MMAAQQSKDISYWPTRVANLFHHDNAKVKILLGPIGCGKSVACLSEIFMRGCRQQPGADGVRRTRWGVVRSTYPQLKSTTIKTWQEWFPPEVFGPIKWDSPITHRLFIIPDDKIPVDIEIIFLALEGEKDIEKLMSFEFTGIYINELQYIHYKVFVKCVERVGRYPSLRDGVPITWNGVLADTNPPSTKHWIYKIFEQGDLNDEDIRERADNLKVFKYDPALLRVSEGDIYEGIRTARSRNGTTYRINPEADYLKNIGEDYYLTQVPMKDDEEIKVSLQGEYGIVTSGRAVHPEYKDRLHYANKEIKANPNIELGLGWDFGLTPACAIVQLTSFGQLVVLDELYTERMCLEDFVQNIVIPHLDRYYPFWRQNYISRHDPAGQGESQIDMRTCQDVLKKFGINSFPAAESNAPMPRRNGLKYHLRRLTNGEPGFLLSSKCQQIREGLMGHFQYALIQTKEGTESRYHEKPLKNLFSHICEGLEYIAMHYAQAQEKPVEQSDLIVKNIAANYAKVRRIRERAYA